MENKSKIVVDVLMACHNRKFQTLQCLESLRQIESDRLKFQVYLVDDGSTDGTNEAVSSEFPNVRVIRGDGTLYWAAAMALAESYLQHSDRWLMWLNDDVVLNHDLKNVLPKLLDEFKDQILVGEIFNYNKEFQYGLVYQGCLKDNLLACNSENMGLKNPSTFNGNFVLIPASIRKIIGQIDGGFSHGYADIDYGLRASKKGVTFMPVPGVSGWVNSRTSYGVSRDNHSLRQLIKNPKGQPIKDQIRFFRRHAPILWWFYVSIPFLRAIKFKFKNLYSRTPDTGDQSYLHH